MRLVKVVTSTRSLRFARPNLPKQIVDLALDGANFDLRVHQSRGADDLLHHYPADFVSSYGPGVADT